ncbi:hypothetical protein BDW71DRAFT_160031 [Aspergillus fruticulosus]
MQPRLDPNAGQSTGVFNQTFAVNTTTWTRTLPDETTTIQLLAVLTIIFLADITVAQVIFGGIRGVDVEYLPSPGGDIFTAFAAKEVLGAAGALHTPQVLQPSGIGPRDLLGALDIPVISDYLELALICKTRRYSCIHGQ